MQVGPASYGGAGQGGAGQGGPADRSGMRWMGTARGAYGAGGANVGGPAGNLGGISSLSVPMVCSPSAACNHDTQGTSRHDGQHMTLPGHACHVMTIQGHACDVMTKTGTCMHVMTRQGHAQAAMSIGGAGPRWPMAAAAGANPYLYGGMAAVVGGYGDLQQPAQQQPMLHGGIPYGSMDAMFGVGGQLAPGVTICLMHLFPACTCSLHVIKLIQPCIQV